MVRFEDGGWVTKLNGPSPGYLGRKYVVDIPYIFLFSVFHIFFLNKLLFNTTCSAVIAADERGGVL